MPRRTHDEQDILDRLDRVLPVEDEEPGVDGHHNPGATLKERIANAGYAGQLAALRDHLAEELGKPGNSDNASLARELRMVLAALALNGRPSVSLDDELADRRATRAANS